MSSGDLREKRTLLQEGARLKPNSPIFFYLLGQACEAGGKNKEAIRYYQESIERRPTCARCHKSLGNILIQGKKVEEGQIHLMKAKLFDPNGQQKKLNL